MIPKEMKYNLHLVKYGETFYRRDTALTPASKINVKKIALGNKEHTTY